MLPTWDSSAWLEAFRDARADKDYAALRDLRLQVYRSTVEIVNAGGYTLPSGLQVRPELTDFGEPDKCFYREELPPLHPSDGAAPTVRVVQQDCLISACNLAPSEVCVLNMANRRTPGGGVLEGCGAQEEYLFRCSDYFRALYPYRRTLAANFGLAPARKQYPMDRNHGAVFTRGVTIFRGSEEEGYPLLEHPWKVNMIAVAGINRPALITLPSGEERLREDMAVGVMHKVRTILRVAAINGQRTLILGALGCGAFRNPPKHTAELFRAVLREPEFRGTFSEVIFSIKEDHNSRSCGNFAPFRDVFTEPTSPDIGGLRCQWKYLRALTENILNNTAETRTNINLLQEALYKATQPLVSRGVLAAQAVASYADALREHFSPGAPSADVDDNSIARHLSREREPKIRQFLLDMRPLVAYELPHQLTFPRFSDTRVPTIPESSLADILLHGRYRYFEGGHGPYRGFLVPANAYDPVFHVETHSQVLYSSEDVRHLHWLLLTEGVELC